MSYETEKKEIIYWASLLNTKGYVSARSGNISYRVSEDKILLTTHNCYLGYLEEKDILLVDLERNILEDKGEPSSEKLLHLNIHRELKDIKVVLHAHPPYATAFFYYFDKLEVFSFEVKFYLGNIPVLPQETPTVVDIAPVCEALKNNNIIVLKNHGVVSIGKDFKEAFSLIELLEEQAKVNLMVKNLRKEKPKDSGKDERQSVKTTKIYKLLSKEHIERLVELVNNDTEVQDLGKIYDLTCTLGIKNQDTACAICFYYDKGRIVKVDNNENAEFIIIGKEEILKKVFNREIDPFVASTQGKVKTKGDFAKMSKWYPVLVRTFKLWEEAPVE